MKQDDVYAVIGLLYGWLDCYPKLQELEKDNFYKVVEYLEQLDLDYEFVRDILTDEYGSEFYHKEQGENSQPLPTNYNKNDLYYSEHDGQIWIDKNGRIGVWCEVDGFVAWLDEYKTVWIVDSQEKVKQQKSSVSQIVNKILSNNDKYWKEN